MDRPRVEHSGKIQSRSARLRPDAFSLVPDGGFLAGADQIFSDFRRGDAVVGMDWDNWMEFMVVAKTPAAKSLVREIGSWLDLNYGRPAAG